jgi:hypothetical protein
MADPANPGMPLRTTYTAEVKRFHPAKAGGGVKEITTYEVDGYSYESRVEVYKDGALISAAVGLCTRSEESWNRSPDYALSGMAQTRATSRSIAQAARWIVALAGYSGTPAEEMPAQADQPDPAPADIPRASAELIAKIQRGMAWLLGDGHGDEIAALLAELPKDTATDYPSHASTKAIGRVLALVKRLRDAEPADVSRETQPADDPQPGDSHVAPGTVTEEPAPPSTVKAPALTGVPAKDIEALRAAGCICDSPLEAANSNAPMGTANDQCPIEDHGIPF